MSRRDPSNKSLAIQAFESIDKGDLKTLKELVEAQGFDVNCCVTRRDGISFSLLTHAITKGNLDIVKHLLDQKNISLEGGSQEPITPLQYAILYGNDEMAKLLIAKGAKKEAVEQFSDEHGASPFEESKKSFELQIDKIFQKATQKLTNEARLIFALKLMILAEDKYDGVDIPPHIADFFSKFTIEQGKSAEYKDGYYKKVVPLFFELSSQSALKFLESCSINIALNIFDYTCELKKTSFDKFGPNFGRMVDSVWKRVSSHENITEAQKLLFAYKTLIFLDKNKLGDEFIPQGLIEFLKSLDPAAVNLKGATGMLVAYLNESHEVRSQIFRKAGILKFFDISKLGPKLLMRHGNLSDFKFAVENGKLDVKTKLEDGSTLLMYAAQLGDEGMFEYLMAKDRGCAAQQSGNDQMYDMLFFAAIGGNSEIVRVVKERFPEINFTTGDKIVNTQIECKTFIPAFCATFATRQNYDVLELAYPGLMKRRSDDILGHVILKEDIFQFPFFIENFLQFVAPESLGDRIFKSINDRFDSIHQDGSNPNKEMMSRDLLNLSLKPILLRARNNIDVKNFPEIFRNRNLEFVVETVIENKLFNLEQQNQLFKRAKSHPAPLPIYCKMIGSENFNIEAIDVADLRSAHPNIKNALSSRIQKEIAKGDDDKRANFVKMFDLACCCGNPQLISEIVEKARPEELPKFNLKTMSNFGFPKDLQRGVEQQINGRLGAKKEKSGEFAKPKPTASPRNDEANEKTPLLSGSKDEKCSSINY